MSDLLCLYCGAPSSLTSNHVSSAACIAALRDARAQDAERTDGLREALDNANTAMSRLMDERASLERENARLREIVEPLRALWDKAELAQVHIGMAGACNLVHFDGDDIRGIARVHNPDRANLIAAALNAIPELLRALAPPQPSEPER